MSRALQTPSLSVRNLNISFHTRNGLRNVVDGVSFDIQPGEQVGVVGESGSGKSVTMLAVMGLLPSSAVVTSERIEMNGTDIAGASDAAMAKMRGTDISMIFQNPMTSLNPTMKIGQQVSETVEVHDRTVSKQTLRKLGIRLLTEVGVPNPPLRATQYPHQFSGGMRQRAVIAMALAGEPSIIVADEPTTALDVTVQAQIVGLMQDLSAKHNVASVVITHDLGLIAELADRVMVMYGGRIVEETPVAALFDHPAHPYTKALLESRPSATQVQESLTAIHGLPPQSADSVSGCPFHPRCAVSNGRDICQTTRPELSKYQAERSVACHFYEEVLNKTQKSVSAKHAEEKVGDESKEDLVLSFENVSKSYGAVRALTGVDLQLQRGETLGIAGESGCGKSTLARIAMGLTKPTAGKIEVNGREISSLKGIQLRAARREIQMVFQDPTSSLDRRMTIRTIIAEPMEVAGFKRDFIQTRIDELIRAVGLPETNLGRRPSELSGGQRQRVGIARALALDPDVIILDEPTSALDVSVQAQVINLLDDLRNSGGTGYIFISHDLGVLRHVSDRIAVMYLGRIVEIGTRDEVFAFPRHPYTRALLASTPVPHPNLRDPEKFVVSGAPPDPANIPSGCGFRMRCPLANEECVKQRPELLNISERGHQVACHFATDANLIKTIPTLTTTA